MRAVRAVRHPYRESAPAAGVAASAAPSGTEVDLAVALLVVWALSIARCIAAGVHAEELLGEPAVAGWMVVAVAVLLGSMAGHARSRETAGHPRLARRRCRMRRE